MKTSIKKFVIGFVLIAHLFQFATNSLLGPKVSMYPKDGNWYPGLHSSIGWERTFSHFIQPVKFVLIEPLSFLAQDPDPVPPVILISFTAYWVVLALLLYYFFRRIFSKNKTSYQTNG